MQMSAPLAKILALVIAVTVHAALALVLVAPQDARTDGAGGAAEVRIGTAFTDMAAGTLARVQADTRATRAPPADALPDTPERLEAAAPARSETAQSAARAPAASGERASQSVPDATPHAQPETIVAEHAPRDAAVPRPDSTLPQEAAAQRLSAARAADDTAPAQATDTTATSHRKSARKTVTAADEADPAVTRSLRPQPRSPEFEAAHKPEPTRQASREDPAPQTQAASGNAPRNARAGTAAGSESATATQSGANGDAQSAGNAAARNYPGLVMRTLTRAGKPRVNARGAAVVAFSIAGTGGLSSVSLARSSGSSALDRAAVQLVRRAGPFPRPPQGARRSFSIQIKGR